MKFRYLLSVLLTLLMFTSCYYDVEEVLYPGCDTSNVTFSHDVQNALKTSCLSCHNANSLIGGGINLEGYDAVKVYVDNGKLLSSIKHDGKASPMPKNGAQLSKCVINKIEAWINNGAPNN